MQSSASLNSANFFYVKMNVQGFSKATYILGIGDIRKDNLANEAKQSLLQSNPLHINQGTVQCSFKLENGKLFRRLFNSNLHS